MLCLRIILEDIYVWPEAAKNVYSIVYRSIFGDKGIYKQVLK